MVERIYIPDNHDDHEVSTDKLMRVDRHNEIVRKLNKEIMRRDSEIVNLKVELNKIMKELEECRMTK